MSSVQSSGVLGGYEQSLSSVAGTDRTATDKNTFLKLLIAQLTHQDPLNPSDDKEFIAQLAQFTLVEEMQAANEGVNKLAEGQARQQIVSAANMINMLVSAKGDNITKIDGVAGEIFATIPENIVSGTINIYADNGSGAAGSLVYSLELGPVNAGTFPYQWNGQDNNGNTMPNGSYFVVVSGINEQGRNVLVDMTSMGVVTRVETSTDGNHYLVLNDGRTVRFNDVELITTYVPKEEEPTEEEKEAEKEAEAAAKLKEEEEAQIRKLILDYAAEQEASTPTP